MIDIEQAIAHLLGTSAALAALVDDRITNGEIPQGETLSAIEWSMAGDRTTEATLQGGCALTYETFYTVSVGREGGAQRTEASIIDRALFALFHEYSGTVTLGSPPSDLIIQKIEQVRGPDYVYNDVAKLYGFVSEYRVTYLDPLKITEE